MTRRGGEGEIGRQVIAEAKRRGSDWAEHSAHSTKRFRNREAGSGRGRRGAGERTNGSRGRWGRSGNRKGEGRAEECLPSQPFLEIFPIHLNVAENLAEQAGSAEEQVPAGSWLVAEDTKGERERGRLGTCSTGHVVRRPSGCSNCQWLPLDLRSRRKPMRSKARMSSRGLTMGTPAGVTQRPRSV